LDDTTHKRKFTGNWKMTVGLISVDETLKARLAVVLGLTVMLGPDPKDITHVGQLETIEADAVRLEHGALMLVL
jgi:hypothetical protein